MTDRIDPTRLRRETGYVETTESPLARSPVPASFPDGGNWPEASFGPLPRARIDVSAARVADPPKTALQERLDGFLQSATPSYTVAGKSVSVAMTFRMTVDVRKLPPGSAWRVQEAVVARNSKELQAAAASVGLGDQRHLLLLRSGRATPQDVQKVTQALIDRGRLPSVAQIPDAMSRVRRMMFDHGLGIDCAGYVQQALLDARGLRREQTRLKPEILDEDLTNLDREGFRRIPLESARTGDILVLDPPPGEPPPGHTLMVYERREATADELAELRRQPGFGKGHVTAYVLDSSYGSNATFDRGGVMRQIWWRNDDCKSWARRDPEDATRFHVSPVTNESHPDPTDRPYDGHLVRGVYRPAGETP